MPEAVSAAKPFGIETEVILGPVNHRARRADLRLPDRAARLDIDDNGMVEVDQVIGGIGEEGMPFERAGPLSQPLAEGRQEGCERAG